MTGFSHTPVFFLLLLFLPIDKMERETTPLMSTLRKCRGKKSIPIHPINYHVCVELPLMTQNRTTFSCTCLSELLLSHHHPTLIVAGCPSFAVYHFHQEQGKDAFKPSSPFKRSFNEGGRACQACT